MCGELFVICLTTFEDNGGLKLALFEKWNVGWGISEKKNENSK